MGPAQISQIRGPSMLSIIREEKPMNHREVFIASKMLREGHGSAMGLQTIFRASKNSCSCDACVAFFHLENAGDAARLNSPKSGVAATKSAIILEAFNSSLRRPKDHPPCLRRRSG